MRGGWRLLVCVALCAAAYGVSQLAAVRVMYAPWEKYAHAFAFFSVWWALRWSLRWRPLNVALFSAALGGAVEVHQMFLPGFTPSWADWSADLAGIALAVALWFLWAWRARPSARHAAIDGVH